MERLTDWGVVALWGSFNAFFVLLLIGFIAGGFGHSVFVLEAYGSATGLVFAFALTVWLARRRSRRGLPLAAGAGSIPLFALTAFMVWLGLAYGMWIAILAAFPLLWAVLLEYSIHQRFQRPE
jgi:hypothetical protein